MKISRHAITLVLFKLDFVGVGTEGGGSGCGRGCGREGEGPNIFSFYLRAGEDLKTRFDVSPLHE